MFLALPIVQLTFYNQIKSSGLTDEQIYHVCYAVNSLENEAQIWEHLVKTHSGKPSKDLFHLEKRIKEMKLELLEFTDITTLQGIQELFFIIAPKFCFYLGRLWELDSYPEKQRFKN